METKEVTNGAVSTSTRRAWILMLLYALERNLATPIEKSELHYIAYFANALSAVFGLEPNDGKILKATRGPLYTNLQWELDRLVFMNLASITEIKFGPEKGEFNARYELTESGLRVAQDIALSSKPSTLLADYLLELVSSFDRVDTSVPRTLDFDANYSDHSVAAGEVIDFAEWSLENFSLDAARYIVESFSPLVGNRPANELDLYARYLGQMVTRGESTSE